jgi:hypothetical protein
MVLVVLSTFNIFENKQAGRRGIYAENAKEISCEKNERPWGN